jgi:hypothetical protein
MTNIKGNTILTVILAVIITFVITAGGAIIYNQNQKLKTSSEKSVELPIVNTSDEEKKGIDNELLGESGDKFGRTISISAFDDLLINRLTIKENSENFGNFTFQIDLPRQTWGVLPKVEWNDLTATGGAPIEALPLVESFKIIAGEFEYDNNSFKIVVGNPHYDGYKLNPSPDSSTIIGQKNGFKFYLENQTESGCLYDIGDKADEWFKKSCSAEEIKKLNDNVLEAIKSFKAL